MSKHTIREQVNWEGCNPEIENALRHNERIFCYLSDRDDEPNKGNTKEWIIAYNKRGRGDYVYIDNDCSMWKYAAPVKQEMYVKNAVDTMIALCNAGFKVDCNGTWRKKGKNCFSTSMWKHCGCRKVGNFYWEPEWLEER